LSESPSLEPPSARDHLANERTLLAWVRTALTIIGLGFIVDRLALQGAPVDGLAALAGVALVIFGGFIALGGGWSFLRARRELLGGTYSPTVGLNLVLVAVVLLGAVVLTAFMITNRPAG
jgi:putative membrane protein